MKFHDCDHTNGGDCCGSCIITKRCSECACIDQSVGSDVNNILIGNGFCNDETNNAKCNYDGFDCCIDSNLYQCSECICHHREACIAGFHPLTRNGYCNNETNNIECNYDFGDCCPNKDLISDGICHDETNNAECNYDGGDCCLLIKNYGNCICGTLRCYAFYSQFCQSKWS